MMVAKMQKATLGGWAFFLGIVIAVILGLFPSVNAGTTGTYVISLLVVLGLVVGFMNITTKETISFLLAGVSLVIVSAFGGNILQNVEVIGIYMSSILANIMVFVVPAVIVVALKVVFALAEKK